MVILCRKSDAFFFSICLGTLLVFICSPLSANRNNDFKVYDSTLYSDKPDLQAFGVEDLDTFYAGSIWGKDHPIQEIPPRESVQKFLAQKSNLTEMIVLDIEHWSLKGSDVQTSINIQKISQTIGMFREVEPYRRYGVYGIIPIREYHCPQRESSDPCWAIWGYQNERLKPLISDVDALFPSIYTFYEDKAGWQKYAIAQIRAARSIAPNKRVYAFLWPQYHPSNKLRSYVYIGDEFWRLQLDVALQYADGLVIWGGWDFENRKQAAWGTAPDWWQITEQWIDINLVEPKSQPSTE